MTSEVLSTTRVDSRFYALHQLREQIIGSGALRSLTAVQQNVLMGLVHFCSADTHSTYVSFEKLVHCGIAKRSSLFLAIRQLIDKGWLQRVTIPTPYGSRQGLAVTIPESSHQPPKRPKTPPAESKPRPMAAPKQKHPPLEPRENQQQDETEEDAAAFSLALYPELEQALHDHPSRLTAAFLTQLVGEYKAPHVLRALAAIQQRYKGKTITNMGGLLRVACKESLEPLAVVEARVKQTYALPPIGTRWATNTLGDRFDVVSITSDTVTLQTKTGLFPICGAGLEKWSWS